MTERDGNPRCHSFLGFGYYIKPNKEKAKPFLYLALFGITAIDAT